MQRSLNLDMSGHIGWALLEPGHVPRFDTWQLPPEEIGRYGRMGADLFVWLTDLVTLLQPDVLAAEAPIIPNKYTDLNTTEHTVIKLTGLVWTAELVAHRAAIPFLRVHNDDAKMALLGRTRNVKKIQMVGACHERGWMVATDHEADAIGVGLHTHEHFWPSVAA